MIVCCSDCQRNMITGFTQSKKKIAHLAGFVNKIYYTWCCSWCGLFYHDKETEDKS